METKERKRGRKLERKPNILAIALKKVIKVNNITIEELAKKLGYSGSKGCYFYQFLRKEFIIKTPLKIAKKLANTFNIDFNELVKNIKLKDLPNLIIIFNKTIPAKFYKKDNNNKPQKIKKIKKITTIIKPEEGEEEINKKLKGYLKKEDIKKILVILNIKKLLNKKISFFKILITAYILKNTIKTTFKIFIK